MSELLAQLGAAGVLSALDLALAEELPRLVEPVAREPVDPRLKLVIALLSRHVSEGHVCLPLAELANGALAERLELTPDVLPQSSLPQWLALIHASPLAGAPSNTDPSPLVVDEGGRLYLRRYFEQERALAAEVRARGNESMVELDEATLEAGLYRHFGAQDPSNLQRLAAETALRRRLTLISGGPGTGKTSTVVKILALVLEQATGRGVQQLPRIKLMAPTGKAAVRLVEAIRGAKNQLTCVAAVRDAIPTEVTTIHRALLEVARIPGADALERTRQLAADVVLVDESSMVDLTLMARLFAAVPRAARIILLGDKDQLASVEAGAVLGDLCSAGLALPGDPATRARNSGVVHLTRSYRYAETSGIAVLARAIQRADLQAVLEVLGDIRYPDVTLHAELPEKELGSELTAAVIRGYTPYLEAAAASPRDALRKFDAFRVLCAHRRGPRGVEYVNRQIAQLLFERDLLARADGACAGWPLLVTQNDYRNRLWNGDLGLVAPDLIARDRDVQAALGASSRGPLCAWFLTPEGEARRLGLGRLPPHEPAFALSVHKSQGSEIDDVAVVLPREVSQVVTRELLYTAVTRARRSVTLFASPALLEAAVKRSVARSSGLLSQLYGAEPPAVTS
jgi:exodeoxyribonuclease V alpha subunit